MPAPSPMAPTEMDPVGALMVSSSFEVPWMDAIESAPEPEVTVRSEPSDRDTVPLERAKLLEALIVVAAPALNEKLLPPAS